jgi:hypothetical protein
MGVAYGFTAQNRLGKSLPQVFDAADGAENGVSLVIPSSDLKSPFGLQRQVACRFDLRSGTLAG